ncbi:MAG: hypothetical protein HY300_20645 [Verrucomicrobia bacterium]|nr:hypothetical protein [Verrucomicrobiota bacterium]
MKRIIASIALLGLTLTGCKKKTTPAEAPVVPPPPQAVNAATTPDGTAPAPAPGVSPRAAALNAIERDMMSSNPEVYLKTLTDLLNGWVMSKNSVPTNVEDFVNAKMISRLPVPPPGKRLGIDRKAMRVVLVDQ